MASNLDFSVKKVVIQTTKKNQLSQADVDQFTDSLPSLDVIRALYSEKWKHPPNSWNSFNERTILEEDIINGQEVWYRKKNPSYTPTTFTPPEVQCVASYLLACTKINKNLMKNHPIIRLFVCTARRSDCGVEIARHQ